MVKILVGDIRIEESFLPPIDPPSIEAGFSWSDPNYT